VVPFSRPVSGHFLQEKIVVLQKWDFAPLLPTVPGSTVFTVGGRAVGSPSFRRVWIPPFCAGRVFSPPPLLFCGRSRTSCSSV